MTPRHDTQSYTPQPQGEPLRVVVSFSTEAQRLIDDAAAQATAQHLVAGCPQLHRMEALETEAKERGRSMEAMLVQQAEERGAAKAQARNVTIIVAIVGVLGLAIQAFNFYDRHFVHPQNGVAQVQK